MEVSLSRLVGMPRIAKGRENSEEVGRDREE